MKRSSLILCLALSGAGGCAKLSVEGGDKPIHIVMDINIKIDQKLDQFFAFQEQAPATAPTATPTPAPAAPAPTAAPPTAPPPSADLAAPPAATTEPSTRAATTGSARSSDDIAIGGVR